MGYQEREVLELQRGQPVLESTLPERLEPLSFGGSVIDPDLNSQLERRPEAAIRLAGLVVEINEKAPPMDHRRGWTKYLSEVTSFSLYPILAL